MPRTFLVDGHNALFRLFDPPPENADAARRAVLDRAKAALLRRAPAERAHVVFDTSTAAGRMRAHTSGRDGAVSWSYADGSADEEILRLVREGGAKDAGRPIVVVTDDRELRGRASQLGAKTLRVHEWFTAKDASAERAERRAGPALRPEDFGFKKDVIDLDTLEAFDDEDL